MKTVIGIIIVAIVVAAGIFFLSGKTGNNTQTASTPSQSGPSQSSSSSQQSSATIKYTSSGFEPASTTIKSGQSVTFTNNSSEAIQVDSDPHPAHTDNTELNVGTIAAGESKTVTLTTKGTWGFHNHLSPSNRATIVVQ